MIELLTTFGVLMAWLVFVLALVSLPVYCIYRAATVSDEVRGIECINKRCPEHNA